MANQIAAGEVVERPAAVIKELLENSLDAEARRVTVDFSRGGKAQMIIEDDGKGMTGDEALLSLERHATSKIQLASDLDRITTFGFRGEALPSIASVARFTMQTRPASAPSGTEIAINGGKLMHRRDHGMAPGTRIVSHDYGIGDWMLISCVWCVSTPSPIPKSVSCSAKTAVRSSARQVMHRCWTVSAKSGAVRLPGRSRLCLLLPVQACASVAC